MKKTILFSLLFTTIFSIAQTPLHEFNFDGSLVNTTKSASFFGNASYCKDRSGIEKKAIRLNNEGLIASIGNLPQANAPRTISIWIKFNDITNSNYIWGYGSAANNQFCGLIHQGTDTDESLLNVAAWGYKNDFITTLPLSTGVWYNYTYVYDGKNATIYRNGILIENNLAPNRNTVGAFFKLGNINSLISINADIDELKIYDFALTQEDITNQHSIGASLIIAEKGKTATKGNATIRKNKATISKAIALNK